jgi:hypothetical protein
MVEEKEEIILQLFDSYWYGKPLIKKTPDRVQFQRLSTLRVRSMSDHNLNSSFKKEDNISLCSFNSDDISPKSVLPKLPSGKELVNEEKKFEAAAINGRSKNRARKKKKQGKCKSFSELEFEELKGFMDMGFVFSEESKRDSSLVELIPGLQRFGEKINGDDDKVEKHSKPYLSEAWESKNEKTPLMNLRILSDLGNEIDLKDCLKIWAHNVATTMR